MRFENLNSSRFSQILTEINSSDLKSHIHNYVTAEDMTFLDHFELLFKDDSHYDSITLKSGEVSLVRPTLQYSYTDCRNYIILFCCCCVCFLLHFVLSYVVCML